MNATRNITCDRCSAILPITAQDPGPSLCDPCLDAACDYCRGPADGRCILCHGDYCHACNPLLGVPGVCDDCTQPIGEVTP